MKTDPDKQSYEQRLKYSFVRNMLVDYASENKLKTKIEEGKIIIRGKLGLSGVMLMEYEYNTLPGFELSLWWSWSKAKNMKFNTEHFVVGGGQCSTDQIVKFAETWLYNDTPEAMKLLDSSARKVKKKVNAIAKDLGLEYKLIEPGYHMWKYNGENVFGIMVCKRDRPLGIELHFCDWDYICSHDKIRYTVVPGIEHNVDTIDYDEIRRFMCQKIDKRGDV